MALAAPATAPPRAALLGLPPLYEGGAAAWGHVRALSQRWGLWPEHEAAAVPTCAKSAVTAARRSGRRPRLALARVCSTA